MPAGLHLRPKNGPMQMKWFAYVFSALCAILSVQIAVSAWATLSIAQHLEPRDYIMYVQMLITFITAILLAVFSFAANRSNQEMTIRANAAVSETLARLQKELNIEAAQHVEKIRAEFATSTNAAIERLRTELSKSSEDFRSRLGQTIPQRYNGYHLMFKAATKYFIAIRKLEKGIYPEADIEAASLAVDDATAATLIVDQEDRSMFLAYVTESHFIAETAREDRDPDKLIALWEFEGKKYGNKYKALEAAFSAKVRA